MNDYEFLECDVQWQNGEEETVLLTELAFFEDCQIDVLWKHDPDWRGKIETVFDFATVQVKRQDCSANIVDLKDLLLSNGNNFMKKTVQWKEEKQSSTEVQTMQPKDKPRAHRIWKSDSESAESETNDASHDEESDVQPSGFEDELHLESYKKHASWRIPKTKNIPEKVFADIYHGERALLNPIECLRKNFGDQFLNTSCEKANIYQAIKDVNTSFSVRRKELEIYIGITQYMTLVITGSIFEYVNFYATQWFDNKPVTILSSCCGSEPEGSVQRFHKNKNYFVTIVAPQCILTYNKHMGYVDEKNSYLGRFRVTTHCRSREYVKLFLTFVNIVATICWVEYSRDCDQQEIPRKSRWLLYSFKAMIAESL